MTTRKRPVSGRTFEATHCPYSLFVSGEMSNPGVFIDWRMPEPHTDAKIFLLRLQIQEQENEIRKARDKISEYARPIQRDIEWREQIVAECSRLVKEMGWKQ